MGHSKFVSLIILVVLGLSNLFALQQLQPTALAQSEPAAAGRVHLPLVWGKGAGNPNPPTATPSPTPAQSQVTKSKSGIHMGNRGSDWNTTLFTRLGRTADGSWPAAVVVLSDQLYDLQRLADECQVSGATVKMNGNQEYELYRYLSEAITKHGPKVVIRISPSPGNFEDFADPGENHICKMAANAACVRH